MAIRAVQQFMLGTVLNSREQARKTLASVRRAGYEGIELCNFMIHPTPLFVRMLTKAAGMPCGNGGRLDWHALVAEADLKVVSLHTDLDTLEKDLVGAAAEAHAYETDKIVITGLYQFDFGDGETVKKLCARLNAAGAALKAQGVELLYHNHNCELRRMQGGKRGYTLLLEETDPEYVNFEFDSYWFAEAGANPLEWMDSLGDRMKLWHINDRGTRISGPELTPILKSDSMELGKGNLPLEALYAKAMNANVEAVILESHRNWIDKSPVRSLEVSAEFLNRME